VQSVSSEEQEFRFWGWWLSGLLDRQNAPRFELSSVLKMGLEKADVTKIRLKLQVNPYFEKMSSNQQTELLRRGKWRLPSWKKIAVDAGFSKFLSNQMYSFLSHYAHSGSASLMQLADQPSNDEIESMNSSMLRILLTVGAHFLYDYCELINDPRVRLNEEEKTFLLPWIRLASIDPGE
jgi:hypothetical protein